MKYLFLTLLFCNISFAAEKVDEPFSKTLLREHGDDIFLYTCEKTADCLGVSAGWSTFDKVRGDGKMSCYLHGDKVGSKDVEVHGQEKLLSIFAKCRSNSLELMDSLNIQGAGDEE